MTRLETNDAFLRSMQASDLSNVFLWRNDFKVRQFMFDKKLIVWANHIKWFESLHSDSTSELLILEVKDVPSGFLKITYDKDSKIGDWGFYLAPTAIPGSGALLGTLGLDYAFSKLGLHKICGEVIETNTRSLSFHRKNGFCEEGRLRSQYFNENTYQDIVCFGLLTHEWKELTGNNYD